jgi:hypothetical protein
LSNEFKSMPLDEKIIYLVDNLHDLPDEIAVEGLDILSKAGETEYAVVLAREKGMIQKAMDILVDSGDYLWAAIIAKNAGLEDESKRLYTDGLAYYIDMEMFGRAISAATALGFPPEEIEALFRKGIEVESRTMDLGRARAMIDSAMDSLEIAMIGKDDNISSGIKEAIKDERAKMADRDLKL